MNQVEFFFLEPNLLYIFSITYLIHSTFFLLSGDGSGERKHSEFQDRAV